MATVHHINNAKGQTSRHFKANSLGVHRTAENTVYIEGMYFTQTYETEGFKIEMNEIEVLELIAKLTQNLYTMQLRKS